MLPVEKRPTSRPTGARLPPHIQHRGPHYAVEQEEVSVGYQQYWRSHFTLHNKPTHHTRQIGTTGNHLTTP